MRPRSLLLALAAAAGGCALPGVPGPEAVTQVIDDLSMTQTSKGATAWKLTAPFARVSPSGEASLERPEVHFFQSGGPASAAGEQGDSFGKSQRALVASSGDVEMIGDVLLRSKSEGSILRTERLRYDSRRKRFSTEEAVTVERPDGTVRGRGMDADSALTDINIYQQETVLR